MAESRRRRHKSDGSEGSFSESDVDTAELKKDDNNKKETPEKVNGVDAVEVLKYENPEDEVKNKNVSSDVLTSKEEEISPEMLDEEGGKEGIAEAEDVGADFLSGDPPEEEDEDGEEGDDEEGEDDEGDCELGGSNEGEEEEEGEIISDEDDEYVEEERQQGDGEECSPNNAVTEKELDFDEDRRNPQYIPKKGIFYEHDDRNNEDEKEKKEEPPRDRKKKLWLDEGRWGHDRFRLEEQYPKSRHELIDTYGYDIRNEDGPPRARRRGRYGRGPTKYERDWEDVTAYAREKFRGSPRGALRGRRSRGGGRFRGGTPRFRGQGRRDYESQQVPNENRYNDNEDKQESIKSEPREPEILDNGPVINNKDFPALPTKQEIKPETEIIIEKRPYFQKSSSEAPPESTSLRTLTFENSNFSGRNSLERDVPPRRGKTAAPFSNRDHDRGKHRGRMGGYADQHRRGRGNTAPRHNISPRFLEKKVNHLNLEMENLTIQETNLNAVHQIESNDIVSSITNDSELNSMALKGAGDSSGRPKRYSSLRQRSLPETNSYQSTQQAVPAQHAPYYEAGYQPALYAPADSGIPPSNTQSQATTSPPILNTAYQTFTPTPYTDSYGIRMPVTTPPPRLFPQATIPAGQPILAPPPQPPCIPPNPNIINFAAPPPTGYHQFTYQQQYTQPPPPPVPPAPPNEIYQPGITYYYPHTQATSVRPTVQKRPKAAIPILPPPEREVIN